VSDLGAMRRLDWFLALIVGLCLAAALLTQTLAWTPMGVQAGAQPAPVLDTHLAG
jgi:hypothetical protein